MRTFKATITPTVSGGNIDVEVSANSISQAVGLIKTLPYFKSFVKQPVQEEQSNNLTKISELAKKAQRKGQAYLWAID